MKIGIISDTHDNLPKIKEAVRILNERKVEFVFHCGDFVAPFSLNLLKELNCEWRGVFGNNDGEKEGLVKKSEGRIKDAPFFISLSSKRIALTHIYQDLEADIILFGHTHNPQKIRKDKKLFINPGEVGGWLTAKSSLVILDLESLESELIYF